MSAAGPAVPGLVSVSAVSHGQGSLAASLLGDLARHRPRGIEVILTLNLPEPDPCPAHELPFGLQLVRNASPQGFAANHNAAFRAARGEFFCVLNPDIRLDADPFPPLIAELQHPGVGVAAPLILGAGGKVEDSARPFPTPLDILRKALGLAPSQYYARTETAFSPDWVAGMFMLFRSRTFAHIGGFDTGYHLYYEDVDLCARLRAAGYDVRVSSVTPVVHFARRQSRRHPRYFAWHLASMARFFASGVSRKARRTAAR